jgi:hypothetical protein
LGNYNSFGFDSSDSAIELLPSEGFILGIMYFIRELDQFKVAYTNGTNIAGTTPFLYYSVPFTSGVTNILDMAVVLSSYQMAAFPNMLFRVTKPTYSSTLTSASFGIQVVSPSSFTYLRFFVVYNTQLSAAFFEINVLSKQFMN